MTKSKEAIAIVLDIGPSMRFESYNLLQKSLKTIQLIIQGKIFSESKDEIALILLGTKETINTLHSETEYLNITMKYELTTPSFEMLQFLKNYSDNDDTVEADFIDALVVAMDELIKKTEGRKGYSSRRLILFTMGCGPHNEDMIDDIIDSCKNATIEFNVIGPDLITDSPMELMPGRVDSFRSKSKQQIEGERILKKIIKNLEGMSYTFEEVTSYLQHIQKRQTTSTAWKALLKVSVNLEIPICLYSKVKTAKANSFKSVYGKNIDMEFITSRTYHLKDDEETEIHKDDVIDGYKFGDILVPVSEDDKEAMKLKTEKSFKLLGFTKAENVKPEMYMGDTTWICLSETNNKAANMMLCSLIQACTELNLVGIVRRVYAKHGQVKIGCLIPHIKAEYQYFYYIELPFAEDVRHINMSSLPINKDLVSQNIGPSDEQLNLIDELMTTMDLTKASIGKNAENFKHNKVFNPYLQRLYQCLEHRALHPYEDLPHPTEAIHNLTKIPNYIVENSNSILHKMKNVFVLQDNLEKMQTQKQNIFLKNDRSYNYDKMEVINKDDKNDVNDLVSLHDFLKPQITEIGGINPVQDFLVLLTQNENKKPIIEMMGKNILKLVMDSFSNELFPKVFACLQSMRQQCIMHILSAEYNKFLYFLRDELKQSGRLTFLQEFSTTREDLGLISSNEDQALEDIQDQNCLAFIKSMLKSEEPILTDNTLEDDNLIDELE